MHVALTVSKEVATQVASILLQTPAFVCNTGFNLILLQLAIFINNFFQEKGCLQFHLFTLYSDDQNDNFDFVDQREELKRMLITPLTKGKRSHFSMLPRAETWNTWSGKVNQDFGIFRSLMLRLLSLMLFLVCETRQRRCNNMEKQTRYHLSVEGIVI